MERKEIKWSNKEIASREKSDNNSVVENSIMKKNAKVIVIN